jgi:dimethylamine monooxygenase subunit A
VPLDAWLEPAGAAELAAKVADLDAHPEAVAWLPGSEPAQAELATVVGAAAPTITACGRAVVDDLCLLDGQTLVLVAGAVAHPNRWRLADKLGAPLLGVHEPVPGYPGRLADQVDRVLHSLRPERAVERRSWALLDDPTLHQPVATSGVPSRFDPAGLWLRVERQALRRLPSTGAVVFAIRTRQWVVESLADHPDQAAGLAASLRSTPDDLAFYKGVSAIRPALLAWLDEASAPRP